MPRIKTIEETYDYCLAEGHVRIINEINHDKIKSIVENADTSVKLAEIISKNIDKNGLEWVGVYVNYYEALRMLTEAFLEFDKISISNHQCLFAYLCTKHEELELDFGFFEKIRTKRNGSNYYGEKILHKDWKEVELQMKIYVSTLKKVIQEKLKN